MRDESDLKSQQIEVCNANISRLQEEIETLKSCLQKQKATAVQPQVASTPEQLLESLMIMPQIAKLEDSLQEAECQKQQAESMRDMAEEQVKARHELKVQLRVQLGKL